MTKIQTNPAPAETTTPVVYDAWVKDETLHLWLEGEEKAREYNFTDHFQPTGTIEVRNGYFVVEEDRFPATPMECVSQYELSFGDYMDECLDDDLLLFGVGLVDRYNITANPGVIRNGGYRQIFATVYTADPKEAQAEAEAIFPGQSVKIERTTKREKNIVL